MSGRLNRPKQTTIRKSGVFDDTIPAGQTDLETNSIGLESDENALRSQTSRILDATGVTRWYSDIITVNGKKRALRQLNEDLDSLERILNQTDSFVPTTNQTVYTLSQIPVDLNAVEGNINTVTVYAGTHFSVSGTTLTLAIDYQLNSNDVFLVKYRYKS